VTTTEQKRNIAITVEKSDTGYIADVSAYQEGRCIYRMVADGRRSTDARNELIRELVIQNYRLRVENEDLRVANIVGANPGIDPSEVRASVRRTSAEGVDGQENSLHAEQPATG